MSFPISKRIKFAKWLATTTPQPVMTVTMIIIIISYICTSFQFVT